MIQPSFRFFSRTHFLNFRLKILKGHCFLDSAVRGIQHNGNSVVKQNATVWSNTQYILLQRDERIIWTQILHGVFSFLSR